MPIAEPVRVLIRTVCGERIGLGHFRRCLTLAEALVERGAEVRMAVATDPRSRAWVKSCPVPVELLPERPFEPDDTARLVNGLGAQVLMVDDYAVSADVMRAWSSSVHIGVIDDLGDRAFDADLVVNGTPGAEQLGYRAPTLLLGPRYALLRPTFRDVPLPDVPALVSRGFVMLGGSDPLGLTGTVVSSLRSAVPHAHVDVIVGPLAQLTLAPDPQVSVYVAPPELPSIMQRANLAVSAAGQSLYELAASGVPTIAIEVAENQRPQLQALGAAGVVEVGAREAGALTTQIHRLATDAPRRRSMALLGQRLVDGNGGRRVADAIIALARGTTRTS